MMACVVPGTFNWQGARNQKNRARQSTVVTNLAVKKIRLIWNKDRREPVMTSGHAALSELPGSTDDGTRTVGSGTYN